MSQVRVLAIGLVALATLSTACSSAGNEAAASIAGVRYSVDDLEAYLATTNPENDGTAELSTATSWLQRWAFFVGIELELEEEGVSVTDGDEADAILQLTVTDPDFDPDGPGSDIVIRQTAIISLAEEWATTEVAEIEPTEVDDVGIPGYLCSSHILVGTPEEALDVLARIDAGEPFADLAAELSLDPGSGQLGGDLGCVSEGTFVAEFEAAAYGGTAGEFVQAVSQFGIHVIEIHSVGPATSEFHPDIPADQLEAAAAQAQQNAELAAQATATNEAQAQRDQLLFDLRRAVVDNYGDQVEIAERYGVWDPVNFEIMPPSDEG